MGPRAMLLPGGLSYAVKTALATVKPAGKFSESKNKRIISHVNYKNLFHREISINHIYLHVYNNGHFETSENDNFKS